MHAQGALEGADPAKVLTLDVPGCSTKRARRVDGLGLEDVAEELIGDNEASGLQDVVLVGHSQAVQAIALMLIRRPDLFSRVIYVSCSIPLPGQSVQAMIGSSVQGTNPDEVGWPVDPKVTPLEQRYEAMFCNDMDPVVRTAFLANLGEDQWPLSTYAYTDWSYDQLGAVPASFVLCLQDRILPAAWEQVFAQRFRAERTIMIDAGHQVMTTRPHALAEILRIEAARHAGWQNPSKNAM